MKSSLVTKLESLCDRHEEVSALLSDAETASNPDKFRTLSQEYAQLDEVVRGYGGYRQAQADLAEAQAMPSKLKIELASGDIVEAPFHHTQLIESD